MLKKILANHIISPMVGFLILLGVGTQFWYFYHNVDLQPQVNSDFFFSKESKIQQNNEKIQKLFTVSDSLILSIPHDNLKDKNYQAFIRALSAELKKIDGVTSVMSLTNGPDDIKAATENPLWIRFLDTRNGKSSLIISFLERDKITPIVKKVKSLVKERKASPYKVYISGIPYIIDEMRRMLSNDMKQFMVGAIAISSVVLMVIFLSLLVTLGAAITAVAAASLTLIVQQYYGIPVGILTANLGAIVYVLTVSHIVFLTSNWQQASEDNKNMRLAQTILTTLPASFWAMATTLLGFVSLIFVEAKPLQQLGVGGSIGTLAAFLMTYLLFPIFLGFSRTGKKAGEEKAPRFFLPFKLVFGLPLAVLMVGGAGYLAYSSVYKINIDPSLLTYFKESQDIHKGIKSLDKEGGSNPIYFVISDTKGRKLSDPEVYDHMMDLQNDLETHPAVGSVLSLPILMKESQTNWLARMLPWGTILNLLSRKQFGSVARGFVTEDQMQALFMLRMKETGRTLEREKIVNQLLIKPKQHRLNLDIVGGSYYLQSELSQKIKVSMRQGIQALLILFMVIILLLSMSLTITVYACLSILTVAAAFLGGVGYFAVPVDIISSPTVNIILGLAVDGMIHLILAAKRYSSSKWMRTDRQGWILAIKSQGKAILISGVVISSGFSVFYLSSFPPSQRFGMEIVAGGILAMLTTLFVLPHLALIFRRKANKKAVLS